jgi:hypothetical protein
MWYSSIRWGSAPLNALTSLKVAGLATAVDTASQSPADHETTKGLLRLIPSAGPQNSTQECAQPWLKKSTSTKTTWKS